ncbi:COX15/CtaA family protein [Rhodobacter sp. KR11]|uniref:COX15/CtaA family protein n=1 Tax=Rhodobacter sp. KR11 TaxID=2974588 RepID=UPI00222195A0|nr:COX15/CtaA family protein [Rhodobacter sp. KR11]MCW1918787.1 COX15/CtaA family protein [Rhodobacter sp. KR11]
MAGKRSIFEEVGQKVEGPKAGMIARSLGGRHAVRAWLVTIFLLVAVMIPVGGLTRLTESGLSITEWNLVMGSIPPLNEADWTSEFAKYKESSQGQLMNPNISMEQFQTIYWWEWGHRQLGRVIGLVWAVGFAGLALTRKVPVGWSPRLWLLGALIGAQGAVGWLMVSSGLREGMVSVANVWLAAHLAGAFLIFGLISEWVFQLGRTEAQLMQARRGREKRLFGVSTGLMHFLFLQVIFGALVAGVDAGQYYPTWPDMNGAFFPPDAFDVPVGFLQNPAVVQFAHRMLAYAIAGYGVYAWLKGRKSAHAATRRAFHWVGLALLAQIALGIVTVLSAASLHPAISHQVMAIVLWVLVMRARHLAGAPVQGSIREGTA